MASISSLYRQELQAIRTEQEGAEAIAEQKAEKSKMYGGGQMQAQAYIGKFGKDLAKKRSGDIFSYVDPSGATQDVKKWVTTPGTGDVKMPFGEAGKSMWESAEEYLGMEFGGKGVTSTRQLSQEYLTKALETGAGISEIGITKESLSAEALFPTDIPTAAKEVIAKGGDKTVRSGLAFHMAPEKQTVAALEQQGKLKEASEQAKLIEGGEDIVSKPGGEVAKAAPYEVGATKDIYATVGKGDLAKKFSVGTATLGEGGKVSISASGEGLKAVSEGTKASTAAATAGKVAAGVGIATGGAQMLQSEGVGDKDFWAGGAKAVGSALMFTPFAPIGAALSGVGTLLDFV